MLPAIQEIADSTEGLSRRRVENAIDKLERNGDLLKVYDKPSQGKLYVPKTLWEALLRGQPKPGWIESYKHPARKKADSALKRAQSILSQYDLFEGLLHAFDIPLQDAVFAFMKLVDVDSLEHHTDDTDNPDISFSYNGIKYLVEVKGKTKQADKDDILQLRGWIDVALSAGAEPDTISGVIVVNHFRHDDPKTRRQPLTDSAERFREINSFILVTTPVLYKLWLAIEEGSISSAAARAQILKGESNLA